MQVILNENGYVKAYALIGSFGSDFVTVNEPDNIYDFENNYCSYYLSEDNILVKSDDKLKEIETERELVFLRSQRDKACFPYVNRGEMWYSRLSAEQKEELGAWYQAWLDVTDTKVIPEMPEWLANH
jgi:hypothetical protein